MRQESAALSDRDPGFLQLRAKIHGSPDAGDAARVRDYAAKVNNLELKAKLSRKLTYTHAQGQQT